MVAHGRERGSDCGTGFSALVKLPVRQHGCGITFVISSVPRPEGNENCSGPYRHRSGIALSNIRENVSTTMSRSNFLFADREDVCTGTDNFKDEHNNNIHQ